MSEYYCNACNGKNFNEVLNLGETPIAHRFLPDPFQGNEYTHSFGFTSFLKGEVPKIPDRIHELIFNTPMDL